MINLISIIVCTYNRGDSLKMTLQSLSALNCPEFMELEIIAVDNNSSDATKETIMKFIENGICNIRYLFERRQGLSYARNAGLCEAKGEVILFTDDDVIVDPNWLVEIVRTFAKYDADCVGGKILPIWPGERPSWLSRNNENILALLDYGESTLELNIDDPTLFGANIAFSRRILNRVGNFSTSLGRKGNKLYCGEDTDMYLRVFQANGKVIYQPKAIVQHIISANRLKKNYFRKWHFDAGEGQGINLGSYNNRNILEIPYYIIRQLLINSISYIISLISLKSAAIFFHELNILYYLGFMYSRVNYYLNRDVSSS